MLRNLLVAKIGIAATVAASVIALTACSSGSSDTAATTAPASAAASTTASSAASPAASGAVGTSPGTWSPLHVTLADNGKSIDMVPQQALLVNIDSKPGIDLYVKSSDEKVAGVEQEEKGDGGYSAVPAVLAVAPGDATITVQEISDGSNDTKEGTATTVLTFTVHVAQKQ